MFTESKWKHKMLHKEWKSHGKDIQKLIKSVLWDWKKLLMYAKVFAFAVLKVFGLRDDVLELLKVERLKRGWLRLCKILMKSVLLRQAKSAKKKIQPNT